MPNTQKRSVMQDWVLDLSYMQQSVLIAAVRGPDGIPKNHITKRLLRWYRRCILLSAFEGLAIRNPYYGGGGSFTGPSLVPEIGSQSQYHLSHQAEAMWNPMLPSTEAEPPWHLPVVALVEQYLCTIDELPHHFQLHFMHAVEILGYLHPEKTIREHWFTVYQMIVKDAHLNIETKEQMMKRLGDNEQDWRSAEVITAD